MKDKFTIGVLTSGGDAPGMNAAIRAVVRTALTNNMEVVGIQHGYEGLINGEFRRMGLRDVGGILQRGGTVLLTSRSKRFMEPAGQRDAIRKMNEAGINALIVIGGEGSMNGAYALSQNDVKVIGIPGSIDNDIWGTNIGTQLWLSGCDGGHCLRRRSGVDPRSADHDRRSGFGGGGSL